MTSKEEHNATQSPKSTRLVVKFLLLATSTTLASFIVLAITYVAAPSLLKTTRNVHLSHTLAQRAKITPEELTRIAQEAGLSLEKQFEAGQYHYGMIFIKQ